MSPAVHLRARNGSVRVAPEWLVDVDDVDARVLDRAVAPVLDIGCGPGRHVAALARHGCVVLGIDISRSALALARARGVVALERSVFARVPGAGRWRTALLLDGNLGIGGDPANLLARVRDLLAPGGTALVEAEAPGGGRSPSTVRLEIGASAGPWFTLATVPAGDVPGLANRAGFATVEQWRDGRRWFAHLQAR